MTQAAQTVVSSLELHFTPQPMVARGIVMAMTDGREESAGGWADRFCPKQNSAPSV